jgi:hypothetical protein
VFSDVVARMPAKMAAWRRLSWPDRGLLLRAAALISCVGVAIRIFGVRRVHAALQRRLPRQHPIERLQDVSAPPAARVREIVRIVDQAARHTLIPNTCLHRSLALWWLLQRRGCDAALHFGARKANDRFEAHAWVEYGGICINDEQVGGRDYTRFSLSPQHDA